MGEVIDLLTALPHNPDRLRANCEHRFAALVEQLFENPTRVAGTGMALAPLTGDYFITRLDHSHLLPRVCAALCAKERFRQDAPGWPDLPLRKEDCIAFRNADSTRHNLVGLFGDSLRCESWDSEHPRIATFAAGLMACPNTPREILNDRSLQQEFPARRLKGLCDKDLIWRSPETIALMREAEILERRMGLNR